MKHQPNIVPSSTQGLRSLAGGAVLALFLAGTACRSSQSAVERALRDALRDGRAAETLCGLPVGGLTDIQISGLQLHIDRETGNGNGIALVTAVPTMRNGQRTNLRCQGNIELSWVATSTMRSEINGQGSTRPTAAHIQNINVTHREDPFVLALPPNLAQTSGPVTMDEFSAAVAPLVPQAHQCRDTAIQANPALIGAVVIRVEIAPTGEVVRTQIEGNVDPPSVGECYARRLRGLNLGPRAGGQPAVVYDLHMVMPAQ